MITILLILLALVLVACIEYLGHRYPLHHPWFVKRLFLGRDHINHHKTFTHEFQGYHEDEASYDPLWARGLFALLWSSLVMLPVYFFLSPLFAIAFVIIAVAHGIIWSIVHNEMHHPTNAWFSRNSYFRFIKNFHRTHHYYPNKNYAFLFAPVIDSICGTYKKCVI